MAHMTTQSPDHWLQRAKDAWHHVENMRDPDSKLQMIEIAEGYERMAQRARERALREPALEFAGTGTDRLPWP